MGDEFLKRAIELCLAVYRVTERFPAAETLRSRLREASLDIIKFLVYDTAHPTHRGRDGRIKLLLMYCEIARKQNWVDPRNFEVLCSAYKKLVVTGSDSGNNAITKRGLQAAELSPRRIQILKFLETSDSGASMADFAGIIKGKSRKTIERDLKYLIGANLVLKKGRTKGAKFYKT